MDAGLKEVGARIRAARKRRGMTQADFAEKLNISLSHTSDIETGHTNFGVDIFMRITEVLQVSADSLLRTDVPEGNAAYEAEFAELAEGCSPTEKEAMLQTVRNMKVAFMENKK